MMSKHRGVAVALLAMAVAVLGGCEAPASEAPPPDAGPTEGVFGRVAPAVGGVPSVVLLEPDATGAPVAPAGGARPEPIIDQRGLQFTPRHLVVRVGDTVRFTNSESISHNVQMRDAERGATVLDVDTPPGESADMVVEREGGYDILCSVHPGMTAFLFATAAPIAAFAEPDGTFEIASVPAGAYRLTVWSLDEAARSARSVVVREGVATEVSGASDG